MAQKARSALAGLIAIAATANLGAAAKKSADYSSIYANELTTMNYLVSSIINEHAMFANMIDGLTEYDRYGVLKPSIAKSWTVSPDGTVYTFKLREGVRWVTSNGKDYADVTAQDFVDGVKYVLAKESASKVADIVVGVLKNAPEYYNGKLTDFSQVGVKAKDKYTLEYTLAKPVPYFLSMLTYVCFFPVNGKFLAETGKRFGTDNKTVLYNGAYVMDTFEPQSSRELIKNEKYWDKDNVYINRLRYKYNKESTTLGPELFLRGDVSGLEEPLPVTMMDSWMKDPAKKAQIHPAQLNTFSYFYCLNFVPKFDAQYNPDNWKVVVNNKAFRKALFHGMDRRAAMVTLEPFHPERMLMTTITPRNFASAGGKDYVDMPALAAIAKTESFNKTLALKYKAQALKELKGKATFPVKMPMPYNVSQTDWVNRVQVIEQQMEGLLGKDFIDIIPVSYPATGFLAATRRPGFYAMQECRWGPDYADPQTYTDPFVAGTTYNRPEFAAGYADKNGKPKYDNMVAAAMNETKDLKKRYELFAKAEAFLINEAFIIPYAVGGGGFEATRLEPFSNPFAPFGVSNYKFKFRTVLPKPVPTEQYVKLEAAWQKARNAALAKAK